MPDEEKPSEIGEEHIPSEPPSEPEEGIIVKAGGVPPELPEKPK